ncbi:hypothetical protein [Hyalangium gracile]|uniref:hypothetical protein n=1 Tax=Hyalangium gracile TaxID=394092 RepID=UPI001CC9DE25|nr:hypothetical protein [Hyalangium gracile]
MTAYFQDWSFHSTGPDERFDLDRAFRHYAPRFRVRDVPPNLEALRQGRWQREYEGEHGEWGYRRAMEALYGRSKDVRMTPRLHTLGMEAVPRDRVRTWVDFDSRVVMKGWWSLPVTLPLRARLVWVRETGPDGALVLDAQGHETWRIVDEVLSLRRPRLLGR